MLSVASRLNRKMSSYQYRHPNVKDKTVSRPPYLYHGKRIPWKTVFILKRGSGEITLCCMKYWHRINIPSSYLSPFEKRPSYAVAMPVRPSFFYFFNMFCDINLEFGIYIWLVAQHIEFEFHCNIQVTLTHFTAKSKSNLLFAFMA